MSRTSKTLIVYTIAVIFLTFAVPEFLTAIGTLALAAGFFGIPEYYYRQDQQAREEDDYEGEKDKDGNDLYEDA